MHKVKIKPFGPTDTPLVIASSAGGPDALRQLLTSLPPDLPIGGIVVQHMPAQFTTMMSDNLNRLSAYWIREAVKGDVLRQGTFLVAPGGYHLALNAQGSVELLDTPRLNSVKPAANITMCSVAPLFRHRLIAVVLTGMGQDGLDGARSVRAHGGTVLAQDRESSFAYFMPKAVIEASLANYTGSPVELGLRVGSLVQRSRK
jgi:two-component system, chemotaxis family, protein-glutamate methylesterase/glutaminase